MFIAQIINCTSIDFEEAGIASDLHFGLHDPFQKVSYLTSTCKMFKSIRKQALENNVETRRVDIIDR